MSAYRLLLIIALILLAPVASGKDTPPHVKGEVLVRFLATAGEEAQSGFEHIHNLKLLEKFPHLRARQYRLPKGLSVDQALVVLGQDDIVEHVELNYIQTLKQVYSDPLLYRQWGLDNVGQVVNGYEGPIDSDIDWKEAMSLTTETATETIVAVIDSGISFAHEDLTNKIWTNAQEISDNNIDDEGNGYIDDFYGWDFVDDDNLPVDPLGHGTFVASIIAAAGGNNTGMVGVAPDARLMILRAFETTANGPSITLGNFLRATAYAANNGAKIINYSAGAEVDPDNRLLMNEQIDWLDQKGVLLVTAAGNGGADKLGDNNQIQPVFPASFPQQNILSVTAVNRNDTLASFANYGKVSVDIAAPGEDIFGADVGRVAYYLENFEHELGLPGWTWIHLDTSPYIWEFIVDSDNNTWMTDSYPLFNNVDYLPDTDTILMSTPIKLVTNSQLRYKILHKLAKGDRFIVEAFGENSTTWSLVDRVIGNNTDIPSLRYSDLSAFGDQEILLRFRLISDQEFEADGVYIDNVEIRASIYNGTKFQFGSGTSFATPFVSGVAALIMSERPHISHVEVRQIILDSVDTLASLDGLIASGGRLNAFKALQSALDFQTGYPRFEATSLIANEDDVQVDITVIREGGSNGSLNIAYTTADQTATAGEDYIATSGTLHWDDNDATPKVFTIKLFYDAQQEEDEIIELILHETLDTAETPLDSATLLIHDVPNSSSPAPAPAAANNSSGGGGGGSTDIDILVALFFMLTLNAYIRRQNKSRRTTDYYEHSER